MPRTARRRGSGPRIVVETAPVLLDPLLKDPVIVVEEDAEEVVEEEKGESEGGEELEGEGEATEEEEEEEIEEEETHESTREEEETEQTAQEEEETHQTAREEEETEMDSDDGAMEEIPPMEMYLPRTEYTKTIKIVTRCYIAKTVENIEMLLDQQYQN